MVSDTSNNGVRCLPAGLGATFEGDSWFIASLLQVVYVWGMLSFGL